MGYYSVISVYSDQPEDEHVKIIEQFREENEYAEWALDEDGNGQDSVKWYEFENDIKEFSSRFPTVEFEIYRDREESEDFEKMLVINGKSTSVMGVVEYPKFDRTKLK